jgi:hypothetical protein
MDFNIKTTLLISSSIGCGYDVKNGQELYNQISL